MLTPALARPAIRGDLEKTPLTYFSDYWAQLGEEARDYIVLVGPGCHAGVGSGAYAMVGMAAFFAVAAKSPTTSILILFEMTNDYGIMPPLMAAVVGSVYISHRYSPFSISTLKLDRCGISFPYGRGIDRALGKAPPQVPTEPAGA